MAFTEVPTVCLRTVLGIFQASHFNLTQKYTQQPWRSTVIYRVVLFAEEEADAIGV